MNNATRHDGSEPELHSASDEPHTSDCSCGDCECESDGDDESLDAPTVVSPAPESITELCQQCVRYVLQAVGVQLDYLPETLPILDHYLALARTSVAERPEVLHLIANSVGAYFGELVRQRIDGFWQILTPDVHDWYICGRSVFFKFNPVGVAYEAIAQSHTHPGPSGEFKLARDDQPLIAERLAIVPAVLADQYYLLSTRLEAVDIVVETLRVVANPEGQAFELDDYDFDG